jgi:hypothetical protein
MMPQNLPRVCTILGFIAAKRPCWAPGRPGYPRRPGRLAQRESAAFTRQRSLVRNQQRPLQAVQGKFGETAAGTVADVTERWLEHLEPDISPATASVYRVYLRNWIAPRLGEQKVDLPAEASQPRERAAGAQHPSSGAGARRALADDHDNNIRRSSSPDRATCHGGEKQLRNPSPHPVFALATKSRWPLRLT